MRRRYSPSPTPGGNWSPWVRYMSQNARITPSRTRARSAGIGSNSRRRTISKDSSGDAGCHWAALRATTFLSFSSAVLAPGAAHLHVGGGDGDQHHHVGHRGGGLGEGLGEGELGVEVSPGAALASVVVGSAVAQLAGVGDPFVYEHHRGAEALEQRREGSARTGAGEVVGPHDVVAVLAAQLVGEPAPQGVQADAAPDRLRCRRRDHLTHQHGPVHIAGKLEAVLGEHVGESGQLGCVSPRRQVVQRYQGVGLAPAKVGLQLDHRVAALARRRRAGQQIA